MPAPRPRIYRSVDDQHQQPAEHDECDERRVREQDGVGEQPVGQGSAGFLEETELLQD
jgi:hypothetical protein